LDVVYNHFGPEGNYLNAYAPQFFTPWHHTPWGNAINFDGPESRAVRDFFIQNALYWLNEFHFDGLRLDAVHAILDDSEQHVLIELANTVRNSLEPGRHIHLILENDNNEARYLKRLQSGQTSFYNAQWNDDIHHAVHVLITGEQDGYYADYSQSPAKHLGRCLVEGFAYQGEVSLLRNGRRRGEPSAQLPPSAFISFLQNHDQIGNRAYGERIATLADPPALRAAAAILLLAPSPPLLFMGEEFGTETPFLFFCDFEKGLAEAVAAGRRNEFARFTRFRDPETRAGIPDPNAATTFESSQLNWNDVAETKHQEWLQFYRHLLSLRRKHIVPLLTKSCGVRAEYQLLTDKAISARWEFHGGSNLILFANLGVDSVPALTLPGLSIIYASDELKDHGQNQTSMPGWSVMWFLQS
jgi:maltooligosyltrehalose trehalohydrolase